MNSAAAPARPGLPRAVKLFGLVSLLNDFASEMIYPLLPAFVTGVLGAGAGACGLIENAAAATRASAARRDIGLSLQPPAVAKRQPHGL